MDYYGSEKLIREQAEPGRLGSGCFLARPDLHDSFLKLVQCEKSHVPHARPRDGCRDCALWYEYTANLEGSAILKRNAIIIQLVPRPLNLQRLDEKLCFVRENGRKCSTSLERGGRSWVYKDGDHLRSWPGIPVCRCVPHECAICKDVIPNLDRQPDERILGLSSESPEPKNRPVIFP